MLNTDTIDKYLLVTEIGQGTFGTAWKAVDLETEKVLCVKIFDPIKMAKSEGKQQRFVSNAGTTEREPSMLLKSMRSSGVNNFSSFIEVEDFDQDEKYGVSAMMEEESYVKEKKYTTKVNSHTIVGDVLTMSYEDEKEFFKKHLDHLHVLKFYNNGESIMYNQLKP